MKWSDLGRNQRILAIVGTVAALALVVAVAYALGRATRDEGEAASETTATAETTATSAPGPAEAAQEPAGVQPEPATPPAADDQTPDSGPSDEQSARVFGQLKGIRDESGGAWAELYVDVDTAAFLTGQQALDWMISRGDEAFYNANYWYARNDEHSVASFRVLADDQPAVWMYTWPDVPAPGFYGPGMDKQIAAFGEFYDRIYMNEDADGLLNRYYWFTVENEHVTVIEEQPRDPYYEP